MCKKEGSPISTGGDSILEGKAVESVLEAGIRECREAGEAGKASILKKSKLSRKRKDQSESSSEEPSSNNDLGSRSRSLERRRRQMRRWRRCSKFSLNKYTKGDVLMVMDVVRSQEMFCQQSK